MGVVAVLAGCGKESPRATPAAVEAGASSTRVEAPPSSPPPDARAPEAGPKSMDAAAAVVVDAGALVDASDASISTDAADAELPLEAGDDAGPAYPTAPVTIDKTRPEEGMPEKVDAASKLCGVVLRRNARAFAGLAGEAYATDSKFDSLNFLCWPQDKGAWAVVFSETEKHRKAEDVLVVTASYRMVHADAQGTIVYADPRAAEFSSTGGLTFLASPIQKEVLALLVRTHPGNPPMNEERVWLKVEGAHVTVAGKPFPKE